MGNFIWFLGDITLDFRGDLLTLCVALRLDGFTFVKLQIQILSAIDKLLVSNTTESFHLVAVFHPSRSRNKCRTAINNLSL